MVKILKLFQLVNASTRRQILQHGEPVYFDSKRAAKHHRDKLAAETDGHFAVGKGPDHQKYRGEPK